MVQFNTCRPHKVILTAFLCISFSLCANNKWLVNSEIRSAIICVAESQLDVREATGNNDGKQIKKYLKTTGLPEGYPWCAAYVSWCFEQATPAGPRSARVVDWFDSNIIWKKEWGSLNFTVQPATVGALYYANLGRYGHIVIIIGEDKNNFYTIEGNTNALGSREGQGVYKKVRSKKSIAALADYCVSPKQFFEQYKTYLN